MDINSYPDELYHWGKKGMKWGVRRYQNSDGSLTNAGKKRYDRDQLENRGKQKGNKVGTADANRWVKEDLTRTKTLTESSNRMASELKKANDTAIKNKPKNKMDFSNMSDKEMRDQINRAFLEKQYDDMFNPKTTSKGRDYAGRILETTGTILSIGGSALGIALAIKDLRG